MEKRASLLVAEVDSYILTTAADELRSAGYEITKVGGGADAIAAACQGVDFVILELLFADMDGVDVVRRLRTVSAVPIIVCTSRAGRDDRLGALHAGADDFLAKPFQAAELLARMRAVRRRAQSSGHCIPPIVIGEYEVNLSARVARGRDGRQLRFTATQWAVLEALAQRPGNTIHHAQILEQVWGPGYGSETQYLRQYIAQLRRKLEADPQRPRYLITVPGVGYRLSL